MNTVSSIPATALQSIPVDLVSGTVQEHAVRQGTSLTSLPNDILIRIAGYAVHFEKKSSERTFLHLSKDFWKLVPSLLKEQGKANQFVRFALQQVKGSLLQVPHKHFQYFENPEIVIKIQSLYLDEFTPTPEELNDILFEFTYVKSLYLQAINDEHLQVIGGQSRFLRNLHIVSDQISTEGIRSLKHLPIKRFTLQDTCIDQEAVQLLSGFSDLEVLDIDVADSVVDVTSLQKLKKLRKFYIVASESVQDLFATLQHLPFLQELTVQEYVMRDVDRECLENLKSVQSLTLDYPVSDALLGSIAKLKKISYLDIDASDVSERGLVQLQALGSLDSLHLRHAVSIEDGCLEKISKLKKLTSLSIQWERQSLFVPIEFEPLSNLTNLKELCLIRVPFTTYLFQAIGSCTQLESLEISFSFMSGEEVDTLNDMMKCLLSLKNLKELKIHSQGILDVETVNLLGDLPNLEKLHIFVELYPVTGLEDLEKFSSLKKLKELKITGSMSSKAIEALSSITSLRHLEITSHGTIHTLANFVRLKNLEYLDIGCSVLSKKALRSLKPLASLEELCLRIGGTCACLEELCDDDGFKKLETLRITFTDDPLEQDFEDFSSVRESLDVEMNFFSGDVQEHVLEMLIDAFPGITKLDLEDTSVTDSIFPMLESLDRLKYLSVTRCSHITHTAVQEFLLDQPDIEIQAEEIGGDFDEQIED